MAWRAVPFAASFPAPAGLVLCALLSAAIALPARAGAEVPPAYRPPVDAPVVDGFRPPSTPYGTGNRGLEYGTVPGSEVRVAADGVVVFAGSVAASRHVTVRHRDGLRTSYSFLDEVAVVVGQHLVQGQRVGTTVAHLHFGARQGDDYLDPAALFGNGRIEVRLVPFDTPPGEGDRGERRAISQLIGALGGLAGDLSGLASGSAGAVVGWLSADGSQLLRTGFHYANRFLPANAQLDLALTLLQARQRAGARSQRPCSAADVAPSAPPGRRVAVLVAGLGSNSRGAAVEDIATTDLGYLEPDVLRFSYRGGRTPDRSDGFTSIEERAYEPADTQIDLHATARHLADLVEHVAADAPGVPIDLLAHSQGGLVVRLALVELEDRHGVAWLERVGLVATLGTPHGGADLATAIHAVSSTRDGGSALEAVGAATGMDLDPEGVAVGQLAETSDLVAELAQRPVPPNVRAVSIAARGDLVVPAPRSVAPGMLEVVVPLAGASAHSDLPGSDEAHRELALALAGLPPSCQDLGSALLDEAMGGAISYGEDLVGALGWITAVRSDLR